MSNRITLDELKSYLWNSAVLLRTSIDAGAYKQYIFPLRKLRRPSKSMATISLTLMKKISIPLLFLKVIIGKMYDRFLKMLAQLL